MAIYLLMINLFFCPVPEINFASANLSTDEISIGQQIWSPKDLDTKTFLNGDQILETKTDDEWRKAGFEKKPACCLNQDGSGMLYNWYAVNDPRGIAPKGWHVPSDEDWTTLINFLGGEANAGIKLKSKTGWKSDQNGTDDFGFAGFPNGYRSLVGVYVRVSQYAYWWTSTVNSEKDAWYRNIFYNGSFVSRNYLEKQSGLSVRCVKD